LDESTALLPSKRKRALEFPPDFQRAFFIPNHPALAMFE